MRPGLQSSQLSKKCKDGLLLFGFGYCRVKRLLPGAKGTFFILYCRRC